MQRMFWLGLGLAVVSCGGATAREGADTSATGGFHQGATPSSDGGVTLAEGGSGADRGGLGAAPAAGGGGQIGTTPPITVCGSNTLAGGIQCSQAAFCEVLGCGKPWSLFDAEGCFRKVCEADEVCPSGQRCVPAPVAGKLDESCFSEYDSCEDSSGRCECSQYEECGSRAVCLSEAEFPAESECPIEGLSCAALRSVAANLARYAEGDGFFFPPAAGGAAGTVTDRIEACRTKVDGRLAGCE